ncbi:MAG: OFA family MFS transporter [Phycisphaerae bacterium]|jgi:OFA family oxalate/formate antiporter-like MFS transporter
MQNSVIKEQIPANSVGSAAGSRWLVAVAGVAIQMMLGTVYAWSVFKNPLIKNHGWSAPQVGFTFTLTIFFLGFSAALGGRFVDKAGTKKVASIAAILFGLGTLLAGAADSIGNIWLLWLGYGVIAGIGNGLGYVTPVAVLLRWFPDKKGFITGLAVMGFGLGAAVMGQIAPIMIKQIGIANTFYIAGAIFLAGLLIAAQKLVNPPADYAVAGNGAKNSPAAISVDFKTARTMNQFYILWGILFLNVTAGIAIVSNLSPMAQQQLSLSDPAIMAGRIVAVAALFNGLGRLFWGALSEKIGRNTAFLLIFGTQIPLFLILPHVTSTAIFTTICCYILLCYGGGFGTMPSFTADTFGPKYIGSIYGPILFAWGVAGAVGPMLMEWVKKTSNSFAMALSIAAGILVLGFIITLLYRKPKLL